MNSTDKQLLELMEKILSGEQIKLSDIKDNIIKHLKNLEKPIFVSFLALEPNNYLFTYNANKLKAPTIEQMNIPHINLLDSNSIKMKEPSNKEKMFLVESVFIDGLGPHGYEYYKELKQREISEQNYELIYKQTNITEQNKRLLEKQTTILDNTFHIYFFLALITLIQLYLNFFSTQFKINTAVVGISVMLLLIAFYVFMYTKDKLGHTDKNFYWYMVIVVFVFILFLVQMFYSNGLFVLKNESTLINIDSSPLNPNIIDYSITQNTTINTENTSHVEINNEKMVENNNSSETIINYSI